MTSANKPGPERTRGPSKPVAFLFVTAVLAGAAFLAPLSTPQASATVVGRPWFVGDGLELDSIRVTVNAAESLARTQLSFEVSNPTNQTREGVFEVPLPPHATLTAFTLRLENTTWHGEVQERATARQQYEEAKDRGEDAVLLEAADDTRFRLSLNLPAGAHRTLNVTYLQPVALESGARTYRLGLGTLGEIDVPIGPVHATVRIDSASGLGTVHAPGMALSPQNITPHRYVGKAAHDGSGPYEDLVVLWTEGHGAWRPTLVSSVAPGAPGSDNATVVASLVPPATEGQGLARDIVFVLDNSGSMSGDKIVQARESLREVLLTLRPDDRFGLVTFESTVHRVTPTLSSATDQNVQDARAFLATVEARGGTNFAGGLVEGLDLLHTEEDAERVPLLVVLSDGMPTAGITDPRLIVANMQDANTRGAAVHVLAIGLDADDTFLEDVTSASGGTLTMLDPNDDLRARLNGFYASLEDPILTNVRVTVDGADIRDRYPTRLPALYDGDTVRIAFRADLRADEPLRVHLQATSAEGPQNASFVFDPENITVLADAERVWGSMHVAALLAKEWSEGTDSPLRGEIIEAAKAYGIVTRYTSWVILRPESTVTPEVPYQPSTAGGTLGSVPPGTPMGTPTQSASGDTAFKRNGDGTTAAGGNTAAPHQHDSEANEDEDTPAPSVVLLLAGLVAIAAVLRRRV